MYIGAAMDRQMQRRNSSPIKSPMKMYVIKRDGREERVMFDKITSRLEKLCYGLNPNFIDPTQVTMKVIQGVYAMRLWKLAHEKTKMTLLVRLTRTLSFIPALLQ